MPTDIDGGTFSWARCFGHPFFFREDKSLSLPHSYFYVQSTPPGTNTMKHGLTTTKMKEWKAEESAAMPEHMRGHQWPRAQSLSEVLF